MDAKTSVPYLCIDNQVKTYVISIVIEFDYFPSRSVLTCKYNTSVDNTTLYLYTKVVYFVSATCFDLVRSSSGPPRRQIKELFMFKLFCQSDMFRPYKIILRHSKETDTKVVYVSLQWNINNSRICLLGGPEDELIRSKHVALTKYTIF